MSADDSTQVPRFASLWWVREEFWKRELPLYDEISQRDTHPGASLLSEAADRDFDAVPMLFGRTRPCPGGVKMTGLSRKNPKAETWFGCYRFPAMIRRNDWPTREDMQRADPPGIAIPNTFKPEATQHEREQLKTWCRRNRLKV